jgi:MscS family membrane protein
LVWVLGAWAVFRWIDLIGDVIEERLTSGDRGSELTQMLWPVASLATKILLFLATLFHLMSIFSWDVSTVLAGLGIGGFAFALGAQDSLKNLFGSFTLIADRPFVVGEHVKIGDQEGVVELVGLRSTRIRAPDDTLLTVPNSNLTTMNITNYGRRRLRHYAATLSVVHATPLDRLAAFRAGIRNLILQHEHINKERFEVAISNLGPSSIDLQLSVYFEGVNRAQEVESREALILAIVRLAESLQVEFAYPTHTVHVAAASTPASVLPLSANTTAWRPWPVTASFGTDSSREAAS